MKRISWTVLLVALGFGFCRSASAEPISPFGEPIKAGNMLYHHATRWDDHFGQGRPVHV